MNTRKKAPKRKNPLEAVRTYKAIERKKENKLTKKKGSKFFFIFKQRIGTKWGK